MVLSVDIETFSSVDLKTCGVYKYSESSDFEILLLAYAFDDEAVQIVDIASGESIPDNIVSAISDNSIIKTAFNAAFERTCLSKHLGRELSPDSWECTAVKAASLSLPASLENVANVLKLTETKMNEGKDLIKYFSVPCTPTKANGSRIRNLPCHAVDKWDLFKTYCKQDVIVEREIRKRLSEADFLEQHLYAVDQLINDTGVFVDMQLVEQAIKIDALCKDDDMSQAKELTGLTNPNSVAQLKEWLSNNGLEVDELSKKTVQQLVKENDGDIQELLNLRLRMSKTSTKKYEAVNRSVCGDSRVRGLFQFLGANRTGRWSGRILQTQNLPQNHLKDLELARRIVRTGDYELLHQLYDSVPAVLSELIRTMLISADGHRFIVADFSAIEARTLAWLADEKWVLEAFKQNRGIYEATAAKMFHIPEASIVKGNPNYDYRQKGKQAVLACIAKGELVLTNEGLIPIEKVELKHKLWDGENWVCHEGVICQGEREIIEYYGLRATPDHLVWIEGKSEPVYFADAAASGSYIVQTGNGGAAIRLGRNNKQRKKMEKQKNGLLLGFDKVYRVWKHTVDNIKCADEREIKGLSKLFSASSDTILVGKKIGGSKTSLRKSGKCLLQRIWRTRDRISTQWGNGSWFMDFIKCAKCTQRTGTGQNKYKWALRMRKHQVCNKNRQFFQQKRYCTYELESMRMALFKECGDKKAISRYIKNRDNRAGRISSKRETQELAADRGKVSVYDIRNCGKHNRFTVSGCLVHNCGYQGSVGALKAMNADMPENKMQPLVNAWREANPNIVRYWYTVNDAVIKAVKEGKATVMGRVKIGCGKVGGDRYLIIVLPSGRRLYYFHPRIAINDFGSDCVVYDGIMQNKKWGAISSYGGRFVENITQATARDILAESMLRLKDYKIVIHCHDEVIAEMPFGKGSVQEMCEIMAVNPLWSDGLPLKAEGYECNFYRKE